MDELTMTRRWYQQEKKSKVYSTVEDHLNVCMIDFKMKRENFYVCANFRG